MEKFIPRNVVCISQKDEGELMQFLRDNTKRTISIVDGTVSINDKDGKLVFKERFSLSHPLIINAKIYYFYHFAMKTDLQLSAYLYRLRRRGKLPSQIEECEEYFLIQ
jgi:hypothetical protein